MKKSVNVSPKRRLFSIVTNSCDDSVKRKIRTISDFRFLQAIQHLHLLAMLSVIAGVKQLNGITCRYHTSINTLLSYQDKQWPHLNLLWSTESSGVTRQIWKRQPDLQSQYYNLQMILHWSSASLNRELCNLKPNHVLVQCIHAVQSFRDGWKTRVALHYLMIYFAHLFDRS